MHSQIPCRQVEMLPEGALHGSVARNRVAAGVVERSGWIQKFIHRVVPAECAAQSRSKLMANRDICSVVADRALQSAAIADFPRIAGAQAVVLSLPVHTAAATGRPGTHFGKYLAPKKRHAAG